MSLRCCKSRFRPDLKAGLFSRARDIGQISAKMGFSQAIAYDKTLIHKKTKVIRLQGHPAASLLVENLEFDPKRMAEALNDRGLLATDSAEELVSGGTPFREAHRRVAGLVREGRHQPPWEVRRAIELRRFGVGRRARELRRRVDTLRGWAGSHPPPLPT